VIRFCPACGHDSGVMRHGPEIFVCSQCDHHHWFNPKPCGGALVIRDGRAMLSRRAIDPARGSWDVPGGFCDPFEHPEETARRELREETGLEITLGDLLGIFIDVYGATGRSTLNFCYLATIPQGAEPVPDDDIDAIEWFAPDDLPSLERLAFRHTSEVLEAWRRTLRGG
jgi:8-oxo-dGTP diphosphatase